MLLSSDGVYSDGKFGRVTSSFEYLIATCERLIEENKAEFDPNPKDK